MSSPAKGGGRGAAAAATTTTTAAPTPAVAIGQEFLTTTPFLNRDELDLIFFDEYFPGPDESESFKVQHSPAPSAFHDPTNLNNNPSNSISNGDEDDEDDDDDDNDESFPARAAMRQPAAPPLPATSATAAGLPVDNNKSAAASSPRFESQTRKRRAPQQKQKPIAAAASAASESSGESANVNDHRREINRKNARKTRLRKKFKIESMIIRHAQLEEENRILRASLLGAGVKPPVAAAPADFEDSGNPLFATFAAGQIIPRDKAMLSALTLGASNFLLTNPALPDNPIVFVSPGFLQMSGYSREDVGFFWDGGVHC